MYRKNIGFWLWVAASAGFALALGNLLLTLSGPAPVDPTIWYSRIEYHSDGTAEVWYELPGEGISFSTQEVRGEMTVILNRGTDRELVLPVWIRGDVDRPGTYRVSTFHIESRSGNSTIDLDF